MIGPKPNPEEQSHNGQGWSDAELAVRHAEIQKDWQNGNAEKHFEDVLDELYSSPSQALNAVLTQAQEDELHREEHRMLEAAQKKVSELLRPRLLTCKMACRYIGEPEGYKFRIAEIGRPGTWDIVIPLDDAVANTATEKRDGFVRLCMFVASKGIAARREHYDKVDAMVKQIEVGDG